MAVGESESPVGVGTVGEGVNARGYLGGHRKLCPVGAVEALAGHEAIKVVASLLISGWSEGKGADSPRNHCAWVCTYWPNWI